MGQQIVTFNGYDMFEVVSALQKSIRRGREIDAMYWGVELYISGFANYAWKRLKIMTTEDVGLADPYAVVRIRALYENWKELTEKPDKKNQDRQPYTQAILDLCKCRKSRLVDWCQAYMFDAVIMGGHCQEIPDYALDIHTRRGKMMGKTIEDFFGEGSHLENHREFENEQWYKDQCHERWTNPEWCKQCDEAKQWHANRYKGVKGMSVVEIENPAPVQAELFN